MAKRKVVVPFSPELRRESEKSLKLILLYDAGIERAKERRKLLATKLKATMEACDVERLETELGIAQIVEEHPRSPTAATWGALLEVPADLLAEIVSVKAKAAEERKDVPAVAAVLASLKEGTTRRFEVDAKASAGATVRVETPIGTAKA